jgi:hypothetical protein
VERANCAGENKFDLAVINRHCGQETSNVTVDLADAIRLLVVPKVRRILLESRFWQQDEY